jgi:iron uptake system component EfeO
VTRQLTLVLLLATSLPACRNDNDLLLADATNDANAAALTKQLLAGHAADLHAAATTLCAAAPATGWTSANAAANVSAMKAAWKDARRAYQGLEGAADGLFPDLDAAIDTRYDDELALGPDPDLFDGRGFVGLHAIERILWSDAIPKGVTDFESLLPGYQRAAFPATDAEAAEFRSGLCAQLVADTSALASKVSGLAIDSPTSYQGAVNLVAMQIVKLQEAGAGKDESRYANATLADMRADVAAAASTHAAFRNWLATKTGGAAADAAAAAGFERVQQAYASVSGDGLPAAPVDWSSIAPTSAMQTTPFGGLFESIGVECDATRDGSLAHALGNVVTLLGLTPPPADAAAPVRPHDAT